MLECLICLSHPFVRDADVMWKAFDRKRNGNRKDIELAISAEQQQQEEEMISEDEDELVADDDELSEEEGDVDIEDSVWHSHLSTAWPPRTRDR